MSALSFFVPGVAQAQGSKIAAAFPLKTGGYSRPWLRESNDEKLMPWREAVRYAAAQAVSGLDAAERDALYEAPIQLLIGVRFQRPRSHYGKRGLRPSAPLFHAQKPDGSKLQRAIEDAMTGVVYRDDAQIWAYSLSRRWCAEGEQPGADVRVTA